MSSKPKRGNNAPRNKVSSPNPADKPIVKIPRGVVKSEPNNCLGQPVYIGIRGQS